MPTFLIIETKVGIFILLPVVARRKVDMLEDRERKKKSPLGKITFIYQIFVKCQAFFLVPGIYLNSSNTNLILRLVLLLSSLSSSWGNQHAENVSHLLTVTKQMSESTQPDHLVPEPWLLITLPNCISPCVITMGDWETKIGTLIYK